MDVLDKKELITALESIVVELKKETTELNTANMKANFNHSTSEFGGEFQVTESVEKDIKININLTSYKSKLKKL